MAQGNAKRRTGVLLAGLIACAAIVAPASAGAATSIGPNPAITPNPMTIQAILWPPGDVLVNLTAPSGQTLIAPTSGVITSWQLYTDEVKGEANAQLRIFKPLENGEYKAVRSGPVQPVDPVTSAIANKSYLHNFKVSVPISAGETIGVGLLRSLTSVFEPALPATESAGWSYGCLGCAADPPADGESAKPSAIPNQWVALTAQIEPDANGDGLGDETQEPPGAGGAGGGSTPPPVPTATPKKCKKGKKLKRGKCVKKKKHKHHHGK